jgi:site-specific DNA recombinase
MEDQRTCVIYGRQSMGNAASINEQLDLGGKRAEAEEWRVHAVYKDEVSASRHASKSRDGWPRLLADVEAGRANVIWLWESSRGDRRASSWLALLEDCRESGVRIYVETHGRLYDMANPRDWRDLAEDGTDNEYESEKTSLRARRSAAARAAQGNPVGRAPYGYRRQYELTGTVKGKLVGQEPHPDEAPVVRDIIESVARGESLRSITARLNDAAVPTRTGTAWSPTQVRGIALNLAYVAKRVHDPSRSGSRTVLSPQAAVYDAKWPRLVEDAVFYDARAVLLDPKRTVTRPGGAKHLLSLIAACGGCGAPLIVTYRFREGKRPAYACRAKNCVTVDEADLDEYVFVKLLIALAQEKTWQRLAAASEPAADAALEAARAKLAEVKADYEQTLELFGAGKITPLAFTRAEPRKVAALKTAEAKVAELETPAELRFLRGGSQQDVLCRWIDAPLAAKRGVIRKLMTVTVEKSPSRGHRVAVARRTRIEWTGPLALGGAELRE